jgi:hypothetical protein
VAVLEILEGYQHREAPLAAVVEVLEEYQHWEAPLAAVISYRSQMPLSIHIGASSVHNQLQSSGDTPLTTIDVSC